MTSERNYAGTVSLAWFREQVGPLLETAITSSTWDEAEAELAEVERVGYVDAYDAKDNSPASPVAIATMRRFLRDCRDGGFVPPTNVWCWCGGDVHASWHFDVDRSKPGRWTTAWADVNHLSGFREVSLMVSRPESDRPVFGDLDYSNTEVTR